MTRIFAQKWKKRRNYRQKSCNGTGFAITFTFAATRRGLFGSEGDRKVDERQVEEVEMSNFDVEEVMKKMQRLWTWLAGCALMVAALPSMALAAGGGKIANVVVVADTRKLDGILYWWAEMYNESHLFFAILTMAIIPVVGCILGWLADIVMTHMGIDLKHRELSEK